MAKLKHGNVLKIIDRPSNYRPRFVKKFYEKCGRGLDALSSLNEYEGKKFFSWIKFCHPDCSISVLSTGIYTLRERISKIMSKRDRIYRRRCVK